MPELHRMFSDPDERPEPQVQTCKVTRPPENATAPCTVQTADGQDHDRVHFQPRGEALPARGDLGVLLLDENGNAAALIWWPA
jgi:hypothetical protein